MSAQFAEAYHPNSETDNNGKGIYSTISSLSRHRRACHPRAHSPKRWMPLDPQMSEQTSLQTGKHRYDMYLCHCLDTRSLLTVRTPKGAAVESTLNAYFYDISGWADRLVQTQEAVCQIPNSGVLDTQDNKSLEPLRRHTKL